MMYTNRPWKPCVEANNKAVLGDGKKWVITVRMIVFSRKYVR